jgi:hypothetical protein
MYQRNDDLLAAQDATPPSQFSEFRYLGFYLHDFTNLHSEANSTKLRVENLHYDLTEEDLDVSLKEILGRCMSLYRI